VPRSPIRRDTHRSPCPGSHQRLNRPLRPASKLAQPAAMVPNGMRPAIDRESHASSRQEGTSRPSLSGHRRWWLPDSGLRSIQPRLAANMCLNMSLWREGCASRMKRGRQTVHASHEDPASGWAQVDDAKADGPTAASTTRNPQDQQPVHPLHPQFVGSHRWQASTYVFAASSKRAAPRHRWELARLTVCLKAFDFGLQLLQRLSELFHGARKD
jgi:hypothetical protein